MGPRDEDQNDVLQALAACPLFAGTEVADLRELATAGRIVEWRAGQQLFQTGDEAHFLIIVLSGRIRLTLLSNAGRELTLRMAGPSSSVGEMGLFDDEARSADASTAIATRGLVIRKQDFSALLAKRPTLSRALIRYLVGRLRDTTYQLESLALYDLNSRLARFFLAAVDSAYRSGAPQQAALTMSLSQSDVAAILGASRPKTNRAFVALEERGAITRTTDGFLCNLPMLREIIEADES